MSKFRIKFMRVPSLIGGYDGEFYNGMRTGIVWQKFISQAKKSRNDIVLSDILLDDNLFYATCTSMIDFPNQFLQKNELIVLTETYNIIAIGKIV